MTAGKTDYPLNSVGRVPLRGDAANDDEGKQRRYCGVVMSQLPFEKSSEGAINEQVL